jgi:hypothetical protein
MSSQDRPALNPEAAVKSKTKDRNKPAYLNPGLSAERRTRDLLSRMTLRRKRLR